MQTLYKNAILLLTGKSGSGKSTIADELERIYHLKVLRSYTTRPPRVNDTSHTFVSDEEFNKLADIVAFTNYNGYRYCATADQIDDCDVYVIDPAGVEFLKRNYHGSKRLIDVYIKAGRETRSKRMLGRGDKPDAVASRLDFDDRAFANYTPYAWINNGKKAELADVIQKIARQFFIWNAACDFADSYIGSNL